jgi:precorrin-8X/cobalt-precorrin-8 methylmutase
MPKLEQSPILEDSFAIIDQAVGAHCLSPQEYAVARRVIHSTADFDYLQLIQFQHQALAAGLEALRQGQSILVDVTMVRQGIIGMVQRTFKNPVLTAVTAGDDAPPGRTRTETGLLHCLAQDPTAIVVIGNAPTALMTLCDAMAAARANPALVIGAPVGFVAVEAAKQRLAQIPVPQIRVEGRKGGSSVAAAILNALLVMAWELEP